MLCQGDMQIEMFHSIDKLASRPNHPSQVNIIYNLSTSPLGPSLASMIYRKTLGHNIVSRETKRSPIPLTILSTLLFNHMHPNGCCNIMM